MTRDQPWYYCCIPIKYITKENLPLPLFVQYDDTEYGFRCGGIGGGDHVLTLNGICIWHPSADRSGREWISYYYIRNQLITHAEFFPNLTLGEAIGTITKDIAVHAAHLKYDLYAIWGMLDFYRGIDEFKKLDAQAQNAGLRQSGFTSLSCFKASDEEIKKIKAPSTYGRAARAARKLLTWALPALRGRAYYDMDCPGEGVDYFLHKELAFVDRKSGDAVLTKKSYKMLFLVMREYLKLIRFIRARHKSVWKEWHDRIGELQTLEFWEGYLELK